MSYTNNRQFYSSPIADSIAHCIATSRIGVTEQPTTPQHSIQKPQKTTIATNNRFTISNRSTSSINHNRNGNDNKMSKNISKKNCKRSNAAAAVSLLKLNASTNQF
jgi:hypothetical protein